MAMLEVSRLVALLGIVDGLPVGKTDEDGFCGMTVVPFADGYGAWGVTAGTVPTGGVTVGTVPTGQTVCRC